MIQERPMPVAEVQPGVPSLIQDNWYVKFSDTWPETLSQCVGNNPYTNKPYGKFFQVSNTNQVPYDLSYIIPANDYRDVDLSNTNTAFAENLYPTQNQTMYEIQLGFKKSNFLAHFYIPANQALSRLEQATMIPSDPPTVNAGNFASMLRYLGARKWYDSPYNNKQIYIYTMFNMDALIMRLFVDTGLAVLATDFEKVICGVLVNKCKLVEVPPKFDEKTGEMIFPDKMMLKQAKWIPYYTDLRW